MRLVRRVSAATAGLLGIFDKLFFCFEKFPIFVPEHCAPWKTVCPILVICLLYKLFRRRLWFTFDFNHTRFFDYLSRKYRWHMFRHVPIRLSFWWCSERTITFRFFIPFFNTLSASAALAPAVWWTDMSCTGWNAARDGAHMLLTATRCAWTTWTPTVFIANVLLTRWDAAKVITDMFLRTSVAVVTWLVVTAPHFTAKGCASVTSLVKLELKSLNSFSPFLDFLFNFVEKTGARVILNPCWCVVGCSAFERWAGSSNLRWTVAATVVQLAHRIKFN